MAEELLSRYSEKNNKVMPESIVYYRDGLSEGEFSQIQASEAEPLRGKQASLRYNCLLLTCSRNMRKVRHQGHSGCMP